VHQDLDVFTIVTGLLGGLAFFLFGLEQMTDALKIVAGSRLKGLLARLTTNRFKAVFAGAFVTSIIQSSSVTTVLVVGFISAGMMTLHQSIGVTLGAALGTTVTAQIVAFKVTHYALALVAGGFALLFVSKDSKVRRYGHLIMGLGMVFCGMQLMSEGTQPLRSYEPFIGMMRSMDSPALGILVAAVFTGIVQSSSASIGVVIVLASQGFISLEAGIALAFGANIGTCATALLASIGKPPEAVRAAIVHILFKVVGVALWLGFIDELASLVRWMSPTFDDLSGPARLAAETPRQVANAHTVFNVANTLVFVWFVNPIASLARRLVPDRPAVIPTRIEPRFLDPIVLKTPDLALDRVRRELDRLGGVAIEMLALSRVSVTRGTEVELDALKRKDDDLDELHGAIVTYLGRLSMEVISEEHSEQLHDYLAAANYIENIGDVIETNLVGAGLQRVRTGLEISPATSTVLIALHDEVAAAVERSLGALIRHDVELAERVMDEKAALTRLAASAEGHLQSRLIAADPHRLTAFRVETDIVESLKRIFYFAKRISKLVARVDMQYLSDDEPAKVD
jgi:phosphate:Na+ symporter